MDLLRTIFKPKKETLDINNLPPHTIFCDGKCCELRAGNNRRLWEMQS